MKKIIIVNLIDWFESFVDENGSFYCGIMLEQKQNAIQIMAKADLIVTSTDLHPLSAAEHAVNDGLYPVHNAVLPEQVGPDFIYWRTPQGEKATLEQKTVSPRLTVLLREAIDKEKNGILVPREVYFQNGPEEPFCTPAQVEETFQQPIVTADRFLNEDFKQIIAPKKYFDATRLDGSLHLLQKGSPSIPLENYNVFTLLAMKYRVDQHNLLMINTGVVEGICRLHTSIGIRQMFPRAWVINIADATTPLFGVGLGYQTAEESRRACMQVCRDVGIEYLSTAECLKELS